MDPINKPDETETRDNEEREKEIEEFKAYDLDSFDQRLVEGANTGMEQAEVARIVEDDVEKMKVIDLQIDRKLEHTKIRFEELREKTKFSI